MSRKFIASVLATALAITSISAVPAKAGNDDLVKFLAGATALVIIGKALDGKGRASTRYDDNYHRHGGHKYNYQYDNIHRHGYIPPVHNGRHYDDNDYGKPGRHYGKPGYSNKKILLPGACETSIWSSNGHRKFLNVRCLNRRGVQVNRLPNQCHINVGKDRSGKIGGYATNCLENRGYRVTNR
ncbi:hypothetical protein [Thalassovita sp.]|uniref:hypothetical protein n=1 Tax=Thalassovita sp. TaxID=1979401 RepID=UPI0029DE7481|nr:hypothetical protein [Thalassovita sp.]